MVVVCVWVKFYTPGVQQKKKKSLCHLDVYGTTGPSYIVTLNDTGT